MQDVSAVLRSRFTTAMKAMEDDSSVQSSVKAVLRAVKEQIFQRDFQFELIRGQLSTKADSLYMSNLMSSKVGTRQFTTQYSKLHQLQSRMISLQTQVNRLRSDEGVLRRECSGRPILTQMKAIQQHCLEATQCISQLFLALSEPVQRWWFTADTAEWKGKVPVCRKGLNRIAIGYVPNGSGHIELTINGESVWKEQLQLRNINYRNKIYTTVMLYVFVGANVGMHIHLSTDKDLQGFIQVNNC